jgi:hypothetical protein
MPAVFPCHPAVALPRHTPASGWIQCPECGSLLRTVAGPAPAYDEEYARRRHHHEASVGECKARSLERWLDRLSIRPQGETICEIGFGGGWCLQWLQDRGGFVMGLEPVLANRDHAAALGIPPERLFDAVPLPALPRKPTLWLFQDSFEHVEDPGTLVRWMASESSPEGARVLLVAPDAQAWSRRLMGRFWLHNVPDHWIHYSRRGVENIFGRGEFRVTRRFSPVKCVIAAMAFVHAGLVLAHAKQLRSRRLPAWRLWVNMGEMGLLLERHADRRETAA